MSRRKQANPKPLKVLDDEEGSQAEQGRADCAQLPKETTRQESYRRDSEDFDPFRPLMIDIDKRPSQSSEPASPASLADATPPRLPVSEKSLEMTTRDTNSPQDLPDPVVNAHTTDMTSNSITNHDTSENSLRESPDLCHPSLLTYKSSIEGHMMQSPSVLPSDGHYDSTPSSRVASPTSSIHSTPTSCNRGKGSAPNKARRKGDRIVPVSSEGEERYICPVCKIVVSSAPELTKHIRSHNTVAVASTSNACTICGKILSSQSSLDRHMLVHSGERPFKCKICKMAFTTNGNMHRHMRIHEKELEGTSVLKEMQSMTPRPRGRRQKRENVEFSTQGMNAQFSDQEGSSAKRKLSLSSSDGSETPVKYRSLSADHELKSPGERSFIGYDSPLLQSFFTRPTEAPVAPVDIKQEKQQKYLDDPELTCPVCMKTFLCKYGLETHLETHPTYSVHNCHTCCLVFPSRHELNMHNNSVHRRRHSDISQSDFSEQQTPNEVNHGNLPIGFHELDFYEFSCQKFPLVAKVWCENNPRKNASNFHDFTCHHCDRSFPCRSALNMHQETHNSQYKGHCSQCECDFPSTKCEKVHMLQHVGEKVVTEITNMEIDEEKLLEATVSKQEYLAVLNLHVAKSSKEKRRRKETDVSSEVTPKVKSLHYEETKMNSDYFYKLGQIGPKYKNNLPTHQPILPNPTKMNGDLADIPQLLKLASAGLAASSERATRVNTNQQSHVLRPIPKMLPLTQRNHMQMTPTSVPPLSWSGGTMINMSEPRFPSNHQMQFPVSTSYHQMSAPVKTHSTYNGEMASKEYIQCEFCDEVFNNYRIYKGHVRSHMGLSPYKCNQCQYSSADKSTLIRHMRTHNGERPFQCKVCEFAFTTKANCERHVRKKHDMEAKNDIEEAIGYDDCLPEGATEQEAFASPDTICKQCGEDFNCLRSLKHHLRSRNSCCYKPFLCCLCNVAFPAKVNCVRHIQNQHPKVEQHLVEEYITVVDNSTLDNSPGSPCSDDSSSSPSPTPGSGQPSIHPAFGLSQMSNMIASLPRPNPDMTPPSAPRVPAAPLPYPQMPFRLMAPPRGLVPVVRQPPKTYITSPPILDIKTSSLSNCSDEPLDFSMKPKKPSAPRIQTPTSSVREPQLGFPFTAFQDAPVDLTRSAPKIDSQISQGFNPSRDDDLQVHIRSHTNERPFRCELCSAGFTIKTNLDRHLKTRHQQGGEFLPGNGNVDEFCEGEDKPETNNNDITMETNNHINKHFYSGFLGQHVKSPAGNQGYDSGCELAPVKRMLDTSNLNTFTAFLKTPEMEHLGKPNHFQMNPSSLDEGLIAKKRCLELDHVTRCNSDLDLNDNRSSDRVSPTGSLDKSPPDSDANKKKRNSYADSPHKLVCPYCPRAFPWISSLNRHILTHTGQKPFKCPRCPVMFSTKSNRERHLIRKHGLNVLDPSTRQMMDRPYKCHLCVFSSFSTSSNLKKHYAEKHPDTTIPENILLPPGLEEMYQDNMSGTSEMSDGKQSYQYENDEDDEDEDPLDDGIAAKLSEQFTSPHSNLSRSGTPIPRADSTTPVKREPTPTPRSTTPYNTPPGTPEKHVNPERDNYNVDKITDCWKCDESFPSRKALLRHLKDHNIDLPYKCYLCDASFESRLECLEHKVSRHASDWELLREKNKVHNIEEFSNIVNTIVEQNFLRGEGNVDSGVALKLNLGEDLKPESDYQQRKVYCTLCPKRFWSLQDLRRHMRSHTGERPFECDICQKRFTLKHSMMRHRRKHLGADLGTPDISDDEGSIAEESNDFMRLPVMRPFARRSPLAFSLDNLGHKSVYRSSPLLVSNEGDIVGHSDLLHNLLGVEGTTIDKMLESSDVDNARRLLGVKN